MGYDEATLGSRQLTAPAGTLHPRAERLDDGEHATSAREPEYQSHLAQDAKTRWVALYGQRNMLEECRCNADAPRVGCSITARWTRLAGAGVIEMNRGYVHRSVFIGECPRRARLRLSVVMSAGANGNATWMNPRRGRAEGDGANGGRSEEGGRRHERVHVRAEGASVSTERRANRWEKPI